MDPKQNIFPGPRPFAEEDQTIFFGRNREVMEVVGLTVSHPAVLLYSSPGAGKTSLIHASLIPRLRREGFEVFSARIWPRPEMLEQRQIKNIFVFSALLSLGENPSDLANMTLVEYLSGLKTHTTEFGEPIPRTIIFDQFEEFFILYPTRWTDRNEFFEQVGAALDSDPLLRVVFSMREDYVAKLDPYVTSLPERLRPRYRLERLRKQQALEAVEKPLFGTGVRFAPSVAEKLVDDLLRGHIRTTMETSDLAGEFVEPVQLQVVCLALWENLRVGSELITEEHLRAFGDVDQTLSTFYETIVQKTVRSTGIDQGVLRRWFENQMITPARTRGTAFRGITETDGLPNIIVDQLENAHIIRSEFRGGARWHELSHDRFIEPIKKSNEIWLLSQSGQEGW